MSVGLSKVHRRCQQAESACDCKAGAQASWLTDGELAVACKQQERRQAPLEHCELFVVYLLQQVAAEEHQRRVEKQRRNEVEEEFERVSCI